MPRKSLLLAIAAGLALTCGAGCTIQDIFRSTLGGVNSDRAAMNKINPANDYSYPQNDADRTVLKWSKPAD